MEPTLSLAPGKRSLCALLSGKPSQQRAQSPLTCSRCPSDPAFTLTVSGPSACPAAQCTRVLSQAGQLSFRTQNFRDPAWCRPMLVLCGGSLHAGTEAGLSQKGSCTKAQGHGVWGKVHQRTGVLGNGSCQLFFLQERQGHLSQMCFRMREGSLPGHPRGSSECIFCPQATRPPSPREHCRLQRPQGSAMASSL